MEHHGLSHAPASELPGVEGQAELAMTAVGALVLQLRREAGSASGPLRRRPVSARACSARSSEAKAIRR